MPRPDAPAAGPTTPATDDAPTRRPRVDARRNRERLLAAARDAFIGGSADGQVPLEAIARAAGVGIGTLYRHFPTRQDLVAAVYRSELDGVVASADDMLVAAPADEAFRAWTDRYAAFVATKRGAAETLQHLWTAGTLAPTDTRVRIRTTVERFLRAGIKDGTLRDDVDADDVVASLLGVFLATSNATDPDQAGRMLDLLLEGLRPRADRAAGSAAPPQPARGFRP